MASPHIHALGDRAASLSVALTLRRVARAASGSAPVLAEARRAKRRSEFERSKRQSLWPGASTAPIYGSKMIQSYIPSERGTGV